MIELRNQIEREVNKLQTLHALTQHRGVTDTDETRTKAIKEMSYISALGTLLLRLQMTSKTFKSDNYLKEIKEFASELYLEGRNKSTNNNSVATNGIGEAYLAVAEVIRLTIAQL